MKKIVFAALAATVFASPAFAAATDSTVVSGSIPLVCTIDAPTSVTLGLESPIQAAANVTFQCNSADGYSISASSDTGGKLKHSSAASAFVYTVQFGNSGPKAGTVLTTAGVTLKTQTATVDSQSVSLGINVGAITGPKFAGVYSDTIRMSVAAN